MIKVSAPCKIHLLGEHAVVYGKPAILTTVDIRMTVTISKTNQAPKDNYQSLREIVEPLIKKELKIKKIPSYELAIFSKIPIGSGLGSSAAVSVSYVAALLSYLKVKWNLKLINQLAYEVEKVFHGNPSGADNSTITYGGLIWYRKEVPDLKIIQPLHFSIPAKLTKNFILINTGTPKQSTKDMVMMVKNLNDKKPKIVKKFLDGQEKLVRELLPVLEQGNEIELIRIIKEGERNLESIKVASKSAQKIIRQIEKSGGAAKICGAGASSGPTGVLLCYHPKVGVVEKIAKENNLPFFKTSLGVEGLRLE